MVVNVKDLPDNVEELKSIIVRQYSTIDNQRSTIQELKKIVFGSKSEKRTPEEITQGLLFNESEYLADKKKPETKITVKSYRRKKKRGRKPLPDNLPSVNVVHDLPEDEKTCTCGCRLKKIGEDTLKELHIIPAKFYIENHIIYKYACSCCEGTSEEGKPAVHTNRPKRLLPGTMCSPSLLAYILTSKYKDSLPLYRLEKIFKRIDVTLNRTTMANWIIRAYKNLKDLYILMHKEAIKDSVVSMDETPFQVLKEPGRKAQTKSYMWCYRNYKEKPTIIYHYAPSRGSTVAEGLLKGFTGTLLTDGLPAYGVATRKLNLKWAACHVHTRRYFVKAADEGEEEAEYVVSVYEKLFKVEDYAKAKKLSPERLLKLRQRVSKPIIDKLFDFFRRRQAKTFGATSLGKAYNYALKLEKELRVFLDNPEVRIDNNRTENDIRPFVIGRKNWLFADTTSGAWASSFFYSLIVTAEANGHNVYKYLMYLFAKYPYTNTEEQKRALLPNILSPNLTEEL